MAPTARFAVAGETSIVVTGDTVACAVPVTPSAAAVTVVVPPARAVKNPVEFTVPTVSLLLDQVNVTPVISLSSWSFAVAVNCCVAPAARFAVAGETSIAVRMGVKTAVE
nr:hypothetical protein [Methanoculleus bourgensis]